MGCAEFGTPYGKEDVGSAAYGSVGSSSAEVATWRCIELACSVPSRIRLAWHAVGTVDDPEITFDVARSVRIYLMTDRFEVSAKSLKTGATSRVQYMVADVPGPIPTILWQHAALAAGSYDSDADESVRPPWFAARLHADASSGASATVTLYSNATAVAELTTSAWPAGGAPLAGITRITVVATGGPVRLAWQLEL